MDLANNHLADVTEKTKKILITNADKLTAHTCDGMLKELKQKCCVPDEVTGS